MIPNIQELDKMYLKKPGDYSVLIDWKYIENGKYLYKVINDADRTMDVYEIETSGVLSKIS